MRKLLPIVACVLFLAACRKSGEGEGNTGRLCLDTRFLETGIQDRFTSVAFVSSGVGFVAGYQGGIYKTTDSARTWTYLNTTVNAPIYSLCFTSPSTGFAVGGQAACPGTGCQPSGGFILRTLDGGQTWTRIYTPAQKVELQSVYFINASTGFCVGGRTILKTTDGGQSWQEHDLPGLGGQMAQIRFADGLNGYIVAGNSNRIALTRDGGASWLVTEGTNLEGLFAVAAPPGAVYVAGSGGMSKSVDGGRTWTRLENAPQRIRQFYFINANEGVALGEGNYSGGDFGHSMAAIYCTSNGGRTWNGSSDMRESWFIRDASFPDQRLGYAVHLNRVIRLEAR